MSSLPLWLSAITPILPERRLAPPSDDAAGQGGYVSVSVEDQRTAGQMALVAMAALIAQIGRDRAGAVTALIHASIADQGMGLFWNPGLALQDAANCRGATALSLRQGCNGLFVAMDLAARLMGPEEEAILIGSDRFCGAGFDRFHADYGILYGDAAVAALLSRRAGQFRVIAFEQVSDPSLHALHDGSGLPAADIRAAKKRYLESHGKDRLTEATRRAMMRLDHLAQVHGAGRILFPHLGRRVLEENYFPAFERAEARSALSLGLRLGHLGTSDQLVALATLHQDGALLPGEHVLLIGAGAGFSWAGLVVEVAP